MTGHSFQKVVLYRAELWGVQPVWLHRGHYSGTEKGNYQQQAEEPESKVWEKQWTSANDTLYETLHTPKINTQAIVYSKVGVDYGSETQTTKKKKL